MRTPLNAANKVTYIIDSNKEQACFDDISLRGTRYANEIFSQQQTISLRLYYGFLRYSIEWTHSIGGIDSKRI